MKERIAIIGIGFLLDMIFGDPYWMWHIVKEIGKLIGILEKLLWRIFHLSPEKEADKEKKLVAGTILTLLVLAISTGSISAILYFAGKLHPMLHFALSCFVCYQLLAMKSLKVESKKVYAALKKDDIEGARKAVSMIVGRDTTVLDEAGITRAAVETVAENTSDGEIAPLFYLFLFGIAGGVFYKAVNTMDSMLGYKNEQYYYFGRMAARLDDIFNFIPARIAAFFMVLAAFLLQYDGKNAWKIYWRDRYQHASPNSAQTEAACAGALHLQLAGPAVYFGQRLEKPYIGDAIRPIDAEDIVRANRLLYMTSFLAVFAGMVVLFFLQ